MADVPDGKITPNQAPFSIPSSRKPGKIARFGACEKYAQS
jgi:hypothetical protein